MNDSNKTSVQATLLIKFERVCVFQLCATPSSQLECQKLGQPTSTAMSVSASSSPSWSDGTSSLNMSLVPYMHFHTPTVECITLKVTHAYNLLIAHDNKSVDLFILFAIVKRELFASCWLSMWCIEITNQNMIFSFKFCKISLFVFDGFRYE